MILVIVKDCFIIIYDGDVFMVDKDVLLMRINCYLYQLHDVSEYISFVYGKLVEDYDFYRRVLSCACVEEQYVMRALTRCLNLFCGFKQRKWGLFNKSCFKVDFGDLNFHYVFNVPSRLKEYSEDGVLLKELLERFKMNTNDRDTYSVQFHVSYWERLFRIQVRYRDFDSRKWLRDNNVRVDFI